MSKRKWYTKAIYLAVALAMTVGLLMVPAAGAAPVVSEAELPAVKAALPTGLPCMHLKAGGTNTAEWTASEQHSGEHSVHLGVGTSSDAYLKIKFGEVGVDLTVAELAAEFSWWVKKLAGSAEKAPYGVICVTDATGAPELDKLHFEPLYDTTDYAVVDTSTWYEFESADATTWDTAWCDMDIKGVEGTANNHTLQWFVDNDDSTPLAGATSPANYDIKGTDKVKWVQIIINSPGYDNTDVYVDDVTIDDTTYDLDLALLPDIAYNVKTAEETYTIYGSPDKIILCPHYGESSWEWIDKWEVVKGCGVGAVSITDGGRCVVGTNGDEYITVRMVTMGDCHIIVDVDDITLAAEKKWGEIYCTELVSDDYDTDPDQYLVTETVYASFLWEDCTTEEVLVADDAVVDWWLMEIDALADVEALEAALGDDPCDEDGGCGTYTEYDPAVFTYDTTVYQNPFALLNAIQLDNLVAPADSYIFESNGVVIADTDYTQNQTDVDGEATVGINIESPTGVMLVTLADYPIDKHGQNTVCVQHETWPPPPPPPTVEKFPLIAWVGEKTVVEWNLGPDYVGREVTFASERPYSIGVLENAEGTEMGEVVTTEVGCDGIARCIVHSDKSGKTNILAALLEEVIQDGAKQFMEDGIIQQGFIVYWIAIESVELVNIEDSDLPNPAWDTEGLTEETLDIGDTTTLRVRVKGYFVDPDPEWQSTRPVGVLDFDGDGEYDVVLPAGRWVLPDDWNRLAGGDLWELQKPHWDIMDDLDDPDCPVWSDPDANEDYDEEMGDYNGGWTLTCVNSPDENAAYPVIGPFSTAQPCTSDQWDTDPAAVRADPTVDADPLECLRTTAVPDHRCDLFDAVMPPLMTYFVADSGTLGAVDKGDIYFGMYEGDRYYTFPYYRQEIPSSWLIDPYYGEGPAGYRWDSWNLVADAPLGVKGPYDYYEPLPLWDYDYDAIDDIFGYGITAADEQLLLVYTDNHGEAYANFTLEWIGESTINAIACYPFLVGDFNSVISNPVTKEAEDEKDIKVAWEKIDDITDMLYVFVRDYDGEPALEDEIIWNRDGADGTIVDLLTGTSGSISIDGSWAQTEVVRAMTAAEVTTFTDATISVPLDRFNRELGEAGALLFDPTADEDPADYAIAGIKVISSLGEPVDIVIRIYDYFDGAFVEDFDEDQILYFGEGVSGEVEWSLVYGLDADPAAVNIWTYPAGAATVTLADVETTMPDGLLIWHYGGPADGWKFYKKGWGASNTLTTMVPGDGYIGIVPTASTWEIPQA